MDTINVLLGLFMLTALVVFWKTGNEISMFVIIFCGGCLNLLGGYRYILQNERRNMGYSMILLGVVVLVLGVVLLVL